MLKQETIDAFAKFAGIDPQDLVDKIKSEGEEDIPLREVQVFTNDELDTRIKNEKSTSYNEGKDAGVEMTVKSKKGELGLEFEGKDINDLLGAYEAKIKSEVGKPNEKIAELENDIVSINKNHALEIEKWEDKYSDVHGRYTTSVINNELMSIMPENVTISKKDFMTLFNSEYNVVKEDGKTIVKKNGETLKDGKTAEPLSLKEVLINYGTEKKYINGQGGRGGANEFGDNTTSTNSISGFNESWLKKHGNLNSPEYNQAYVAWSEKVGDKKVA